MVDIVYPCYTRVQAAAVIGGWVSPRVCWLIRAYLLILATRHLAADTGNQVVHSYKHPAAVYKVSQNDRLRRTLGLNVLFEKSCFQFFFKMLKTFLEP